MNLAPRWTGALEGRGIEAVHWSSIGAPDADDEILFSWARDHEHVVLTCDLDFARLLALTGMKRPSVVLLRARNTSPEALAARAVGLLQNHAQALQGGAILMVDEAKSRIQILPLRPR
jgi:predicted nuclease of predicted toxin-antitoxin system